MTYYKRIDVPRTYGMVLEKISTNSSSDIGRFRVLEVSSAQITYDTWLMPHRNMFTSCTKEEFEAAFKRYVFDLIDVVDSGGVDVL